MEQSLVELVHRNLMDVTALGAEGSGGTRQEQHGELLFLSASTAPFLIGGVRERTEGDAAELLERAARFSRRARAALWCMRGVGEQIYRRLGYEELYAYRVMGAAPSN